MSWTSSIFHATHGMGPTAGQYGWFQTQGTADAVFCLKVAYQSASDEVF